MEEISKSQNQLTKEIRSLYKKNEEIFSKIKSSDGTDKISINFYYKTMQDLDNQQAQSQTEQSPEYRFTKKI